MSNKSKSTIIPLFNGPEVFSSASNKENLIAKIFLKNSNRDDSGNSLLVFLFITNLKLHNVSIMVIVDLDSSKRPGPDCIPLVVLKNCELNFHTC